MTVSKRPKKGLITIPSCRQQRYIEYDSGLDPRPEKKSHKGYYCDN